MTTKPPIEALCEFRREVLGRLQRSTDQPVVDVLADVLAAIDRQILKLPCTSKDVLMRKLEIASEAANFGNLCDARPLPRRSPRPSSGCGPTKPTSTTHTAKPPNPRNPTREKSPCAYALSVTSLTTRQPAPSRPRCASSRAAALTLKPSARSGAVRPPADYCR